MTLRSIELLSDRGLVQVRGPDAVLFMNDLVTNTVSGAAPGSAVFAGLLTPKGKILFDFLIYQRSPEDLLIDCPADQAGPLAKRLMLYKLRAKIEITDLSSDHAIGASWDEDREWPASMGLEAYDDPRFEPLGMRFLLAPGQDRSSDLTEPPAGEGRRYENHRISLGVPKGGLDYDYGETFPHEACYDVLNGVDFRKGCFVGQEVVSRMHHRGTAKTRIVQVEAGQPLPSGGADIVAGDTPAGRLGSVDGTIGIALVRIDRVEETVANSGKVMAADIEITVVQPPWVAAKGQGV